MDFIKSFKLSYFQLFIVLGLAITGLAAFINTYDYFGISKEMVANQSASLQHKLKVRFWVVISLSIIAIVLGIILGYLLRSRKALIFPVGLLVGGIFGIIYSLFTKYSKIGTDVQLGISWTTFIGFILLGLLYVILKPHEGKSGYHLEEGVSTWLAGKKIEKKPLGEGETIELTPIKTES